MTLFTNRSTEFDTLITDLFQSYINLILTVLLDWIVFKNPTFAPTSSTGNPLSSVCSMCMCLCVCVIYFLIFAGFSCIFVAQW